MNVYLFNYSTNHNNFQWVIFSYIKTIVQLSMIVDTYSKKYIVKLYISNFHFVGAEGDGKMKI